MKFFGAMDGPQRIGCIWISSAAHAYLDYLSPRQRLGARKAKFLQLAQLPASSGVRLLGPSAENCPAKSGSRCNSRVGVVCLYWGKTEAASKQALGTAYVCAGEGTWPYDRTSGRIRRTAREVVANSRYNSRYIRQNTRKMQSANRLGSRLALALEGGSWGRTRTGDLGLMNGITGLSRKYLLVSSCLQTSELSHFHVDCPPPLRDTESFGGRR